MIRPEEQHNYVQLARERLNRLIERADSMISELDSIHNELIKRELKLRRSFWSQVKSFFTSRK